jgi:hypothetical protein
VSALLPWWAWCLLALGLYFVCRYLVQVGSTAATDGVTSMVISFLLSTLPSALQFVGPVFCIACAVFAVIHKLPVQADTRLSIKRNHSFPTHSSELEHRPRCPTCSSPMAKRISKGGQNSYFWGCTRYPSCHGTRPL